MPARKPNPFWIPMSPSLSEIGGVYQEMVYDNARVMVARFVGHSEKEPTEALLKLSLY